MIVTHGLLSHLLVHFPGFHWRTFGRGRGTKWFATSSTRLKHWASSFHQKLFSGHPTDDQDVPWGSSFFCSPLIPQLPAALAKTFWRFRFDRISVPSRSSPLRFLQSLRSLLPFPSLIRLRVECERLAKPEFSQPLLANPSALHCCNMCSK